MANKLLKIPPTGGGGGSGGSGGGSGGGGEGGGGGLPPSDTRCFADIYAKILQLWPMYNVTHVQPDAGGDYFRVASPGEDYVYKVTGSCRDGYVELNYKTLQIPGVRTS